MCYIIYKTTNLINNKIYVGQHKTSADDGYLGSGTILKRAIDKHGKENFIRETLEYCTSRDVDDKEIFWIAELNATDKFIGYNITEGGGGFKGAFGEKNPNYGNKWNDEQREHLRQLNLGKTMTDETKQKISNWNKKKGNPFKGQNHSQEQKEKWSRDRKGTRLGEENTFYGKTHSDDSKNLIGESSKQRTKYIFEIISPDGEIFKDVLNLQDFLNEHQIGKQNNIKYKNNVSRYKNWIITRKLK